MLEKISSNTALFSSAERVLRKRNYPAFKRKVREIASRLQTDPSLVPSLLTLADKAAAADKTFLPLAADMAFAAVTHAPHDSGFKQQGLDAVRRYAESMPEVERNYWTTMAENKQSFQKATSTKITPSAPRAVPKLG